MGRKFSEGKHISRRLEPNPIWEAHPDMPQMLSRICGPIIANDTLLRNCYVQHERDYEEWIFRQSIMNRLLVDKIINSKLKTATPGISEMVMEDFLNKIMQGDLSEKDVLLVRGGIGAGKTTYVHYFLRIDTKNLEIDKHVKFAIINAKNAPANISDFEKYVVNEVSDTLTRILDEAPPKSEELFIDKLQAFDIKEELEGWYAEDQQIGDRKKREYIAEWRRDKIDYNKRKVCYLKENRKILFLVVLDNVDSRPVQFQDEVFQNAQSLLARLNCPVIITMREETFRRTAPTLDFDPYEPRYLRLSGSDPKKLIEKRIAYAISEVNSLKLTKKDELIKNLNGILEILLSKRIIEALTALCANDIRILLSQVMKVLSSHYLLKKEEYDEYLTYQEEDEKVRTLPFVKYYNFLKALMLGNNLFYNAKDSLILNLFDNNDKTDEVENNLIRFRTLQMIIFLQDKSPKEIIESMQRIGYNKAKVQNVIGLFQKERYKLIEPIVGQNGEITEIVPTEAGYYYLRNLVKEIRYFELIKCDTYISSEAYEQEIFFESFQLSKSTRLASTLNFVKHLLQLENKEEESAKKFSKVLDFYHACREEVVSLSKIHSDLEEQQKRILLGSS